MKILTPNEQRTLRHRYVQSDLYRQWAPILARLERECGEADAATMWYAAERQIARLRSEQSFREQEIPPIYNELLSDCRQFDETPRTDLQARHTAATVMGIVLTMLMNAVERGHEDEQFDNEPMCMAIMDALSHDKYFGGLMDFFFRRGTGFDIRKVVIVPSDPMAEEAPYDSMDEVAREEVDHTVECIMNRTHVLSGHFGEYWACWEPLWRDILSDTEMMLLIKNIEPQRNEWGFNQKMVCNVVGMFRDKIRLTGSIKALNDAFCTKNVRSYISNHADYDGNDSVFSREQHGRILLLIDKFALSTKSK